MERQGRRSSGVRPALVTTNSNGATETAHSSDSKANCSSGAARKESAASAAGENGHELAMVRGDGRFASVRAEYEAVLAGTHEEFLSQCKKVDEIRVERLGAARRLRDYQLQSVQIMYEAEIKQADDEYEAERQTLRENMLQLLMEKQRRMEEDKNWDGETPETSRVLTRKMRGKRGETDRDGGGMLCVGTGSTRGHMPNNAIRRKLNNLAVAFVLKNDEVAEDIATIQKQMHTLTGGSVWVERGVLNVHTTTYEKDDPVWISVGPTARYHGTIKNINNSEVCVRTDEGGRIRVYLTHLRSGRCAIAPGGAGEEPPPPGAPVRRR